MEKRIAHAFLLLLICSCAFAQGRKSSIKPPDTVLTEFEDPFTSFQLQTRESKRVFLQWAVQPGMSTDYFSIERNVDGKNFETIGVIKSIENSIKYEFTDEIPTRGSSLYRIRFTNQAGTNFFSDSIEVNIPGSSLISFYPNPADNVLIVRSAFHADLLISDGLGKPRITRTIGVGPSIIDVSTLEKGVYLLRITDKNTSQQQVEKLLKN
jgi:hypothetical protein